MGPRSSGLVVKGAGSGPVATPRHYQASPSAITFRPIQRVDQR